MKFIKNNTVLYMTFEIPMWIQGTIVDVETTGLDPNLDELTGCGFIHGNRVSMFVRTHEHLPNLFRDWMMNKLSRYARPYIAYYKDFEEGWLDTQFEIEIQPEAYFKKIHAVKLSHLAHNVDGAVCLEFWEKRMYDRIVWHLINDLLEELALYASLSHLKRERRFPIVPWLKLLEVKV